MWIIWRSEFPRCDNGLRGGCAYGSAWIGIGLCVEAHWILRGFRGFAHRILRARASDSASGPGQVPGIRPVSIGARVSNSARPGDPGSDPVSNSAPPLHRCSTGIRPPRPQACPPARPPPIPRAVHRAVHRTMHSALHSRATGPRGAGGEERRGPPPEPPRPLHGRSAAASAGRCRIRRGITGTSRGNLGITRPGQRNPGSRIVHDGLDHGPARTAAEPEAGVRQDRQA